MNKVQVDITMVNQFKDYLAWVNSLDLNDVELVDRGEPVRIREGSVKDFKFTGLSNTDFIRSRFYAEYKRLAGEDVCPRDPDRDPCSKACMECEYNCGEVENDFWEEIRCSYENFKELEVDDE